MERYITSNGDVINFTIDENNCSIKEAYKIKDKKIKYEFIDFLLKWQPAYQKRSRKSYYREWKAHNVLYKLHICRVGTRDTDLNINESWIRRIGYFIISIFSIDF